MEVFREDTVHVHRPVSCALPNLKERTATRSPASSPTLTGRLARTSALRDSPHHSTHFIILAKMMLLGGTYRWADNCRPPQLFQYHPATWAVAYTDSVRFPHNSSLRDVVAGLHVIARVI
jgi:hypothetical protein